jgi:hypothetical protein
MTTPVSHSHSDATIRGLTIAEQTRWARYCNTALGLWLFFSAFTWPHSPSTRINTCLVGLFIGISAITATGWAIARRLTMTLALWLAFSTAVAYPAGPVTLWNNMVIALIVLVLSLIPFESRRGNRIGQ